METDGDPLMHEVKSSSTCPGGGEKRRAVARDTLRMFHGCCDGNGHLLPSFLIPGDFQARLPAGPAGTDTLCVPDDFAVDADHTPPTCSSIFGMQGVCLPGCLPEVRNADTRLPVSSCAPGKLCAPCYDPRTNKPTGACDFGKMACHPPPKPDDCKPFPPTMDLSPYKTCCASGPAHCAPAKLVPPDQQKDLDLCADGTSFCVPDEILRRGGRHQAATCRTMNGREGRCLSVCVKSVAAQLDQLERSTCKAHERCAPCYDPRTGMGTGACTVGPCDKPHEPPKPFEECGGSVKGHAYCVPASFVPRKDRCYFDRSGCGSGCSEPGTLCVPKKVMDAGPTFAPKRCKASMAGFLAMFTSLFSNPFTAIAKMKEYSDGRCISKCMKDVKSNPSAGMLSQGDCDSGEICVPCYDPMKLSQGKVPTGACHRPACP